MAAQRIVSTGPLPDWAEERLGEAYRLAVAESDSPSDVREALEAGAAGLIARSSTPVDASAMDAAPGLRVIGRTGAGYDSIDVQAARRRGITVLHTPDAMTAAAAEHTLALMLAAAKDLPGWQKRVREGEWKARNRVLNRDLHGAVVGIVGYGRIGRRVHRLLKPFSAKILACDPNLDPSEIEQAGAEPAQLGELLEKSDFITLHAPLNEQTRGLIHSGNIGRIRKGAVLVNAARGGLIESNRLIAQALDSGRLSFAALDVLEDEPPDPADPLLKHPRALVTAHVASRTPRTQRILLETLLDDMLAVLENRRPRRGNVVSDPFAKPPPRTRT